MGKFINGKTLLPWSKIRSRLTLRTHEGRVRRIARWTALLVTILSSVGYFLSVSYVGSIAPRFVQGVGVFWATAPRPRTTPGLVASGPMPGEFERDERHVLFYKGYFVFKTMNTFATGPFVHAGADSLSKDLARATFHPEDCSRVFPNVQSWGLGYLCFTVPLLPLAFTALVLWVILLLKMRKRPKAGHCECGYSLTGLPTLRPCPECGLVTQN